MIGGLFAVAGLIVAAYPFVLAVQVMHDVSSDD